MFHSSDEALDCHEPISVETARRELRRHGCRIISGPQIGEAYLTGRGKSDQIEVTNDLDPPEYIDCTPAAILAWLGY